MVDLGDFAGFPVHIDPGALSLRFDPRISTAPVAVRHLDEVRSLLRDPQARDRDRGGPRRQGRHPAGLGAHHRERRRRADGLRAVYALEAHLLHEPLRRLQETAHYVLADGTLEPNPRYRSVPEARRQVPHEIPEHGIGHGRPSLAGELGPLELVSRPDRCPAVWERLVAR